MAPVGDLDAVALSFSSEQAIFVHINFFLASLFISTWRDPEDGPKIAKRRGMGGRRD